MKSFRSFLKEHIVCLDGGMGTLLQARGLAAGERPEIWNLTHAQAIIDIHTEYYQAGSHVVSANTFGANCLSFPNEVELERIIAAALANAKAARDAVGGDTPRFVALDIGPTGKLLAPLGELPFEEAVSVFAKTVQIGAKYGADLVLIETMNDSYETKAALLAAKENCDLPILVSNAYGEDGKLMTGATPTAMVAMLEGMGADAIGANCSQGPAALAGVTRELLAVASVPVLLKPNAGLPRTENEKTVFDVSPDAFAATIAELADEGLRVVGGCCGTTPDYIRALTTKLSGKAPKPITDKHRTVISSYARAVVFADEPLLIGERINPTGKKRFKEALLAGDIDYILREGTGQQAHGAHVLDVNVGMPGIAESEMLPKVVGELQAIVDLPLQIDTSDPQAMEQALRLYNGKALVNSVNGKTSCMETVFPLVKKYGGVVIALTLDENGIPATAADRVAIAEKIIKTAETYGIGKENLVFDTLTMAISADAGAANATLDALETIRRDLGCHTSLGVSNVSFGLPNREVLNAAFFAQALARGLSAAIVNPYSAELRKTYLVYRTLKGLDANCAEYIANADSFVTGVQAAQTATSQNTPKADDLQTAIIEGRRERAAEVTAVLLANRAPLALVTEEIVPALDIVGKRFEEKTLYLPQLLMSAEAAKSAFEVLKAQIEQGSDKPAAKGPIVLATVEGDIHDIGKNIVKLLLENYGFSVLDLGKDVPPQTVVDAVKRTKAPICGLSALMTTTVPAMETTIAKLKIAAPWCQTIVGGAVLSADYAAKIGATAYAKDAMETVRIAEKWL